MEKVQFMVLWVAEPEPNPWEPELTIQFEVQHNR